MDPALASMDTTQGKVVRSGKLRACAECRRLKLRCDRNFPCQSCVRRGCSALCPDKCFTDEATPSSLKASSLRNREQIRSLKQRITALEDALSVSHPSHPLLAQGGSPDTLGSSSVNSISDENETNVEETVDIFGSLSLGENGLPVFHGATSMSEHFVQNTILGTSNRLNFPSGEQPVLPPSLQLLSALFPFAPQSVAANSNINDMLLYLPTAVETLEIVDLYWHHLSMGCAAVGRPQFMKQIYNHFYPNNTVVNHLQRSDAHRLGVLFITLALGTLTDLRKPMLSTEAEKYHQLARASLSFDPITDNTTISGLQCMILIAWYMRCAPTRASTGYMWAFYGVLLKLASSIGIFRDPRRWLTDNDEIEQREVVCWELSCLEIWQSFSAGRPCNLNLTLMDCQRPPDSATASAGLPGFIHGFNDWKYRFYPIINNVLLVVQRPGPVKYSEILNLERQMRDCAMPEGLAIPIFATPDQGLPDDDTIQSLQRLTALIIREAACCMLHRRFLVLAMQNDTEDPRRNPFWYSAFQAGYSACWIVKVHLAMYGRYPELISRVPTFWSASFSAAVVLGAIVARYWNRDFAQGTLRPFEQICALFEKTAGTSIQPLNALEILRRLRQRCEAQFPNSLDAAKSYNDLPLLGAQPSIAGPVSKPSTTNITLPAATSTVPAVSPEMPTFLVPSMSPSQWETCVVSPLLCGPNEKGEDLRCSPDLRLFHDNNGGGFHVPWTNGEGWQPPAPEGVSNAPLEGYAPALAPSGAEVGQWNQFLDRLGVWES